MGDYSPISFTIKRLILVIQTCAMDLGKTAATTLFYLQNSRAEKVERGEICGGETMMWRFCFLTWELGMDIWCRDGPLKSIEAPLTCLDYIPFPSHWSGYKVMPKGWQSREKHLDGWSYLFGICWVVSFPFQSSNTWFLELTRTHTKWKCKSKLILWFQSQILFLIKIDTNNALEFLFGNYHICGKIVCTLVITNRNHPSMLSWVFLEGKKRNRKT